MPKQQKEILEWKVAVKSADSGGPDTLAINPDVLNISWRDFPLIAAVGEV